MAASPHDRATGDVERWIREARKGSAEALGRVLEHFRRPLLRLADRRLDPELRPKGGGSDLVQETFLEAQRDFPSFAGSSEKEAGAWLSRILINNLKNFARSYRQAAKRRLKRERSLDDGRAAGTLRDELVAPARSPSSALARDEEAEALVRAVAGLPEHYRRVVDLRLREGRGFDEIAAEIGRSTEATRMLWFRAVNLLAERMKAPGRSG